MCKMSIYVFSATGNSLTTAFELKKYFSESKIVSVASLMNQEEIVEEADVVGFVFPIYFQDVPYPVKYVIQHMKWRSKSPYIFCMSTSRNVPSTDQVYQRLNQMLLETGQKLSLACPIAMPGNSWMNAAEVDEYYLQHQKEAVSEWIAALKKHEVKEYGTQDKLPQTPVSSPNNYRGIIADTACIGCGRCVAVCPMNNITLKQNQAVIKENCAICLACFHWCPQEAIYMSKNMEDGRRKKYHHPDVCFEQIVKCKTR